MHNGARTLVSKKNSDSTQTITVSKARQAEGVDSNTEGWIDSGHEYAARKTNELTQWVDTFFGNNERDLEQAESRLRLRTIYNSSEQFGDDLTLRLGGKVSLPQISKRLDLVFRAEDTSDMSKNSIKDASENRVGLQYQVGPEGMHNHRLDLSVGFGSSGPKPGLKYVYKNDLTKNASLRFSQRFTYDLDEGGYGSSRVVVDRALGNRKLVRIYTGLLYGEKTDGKEWSSSVSYVQGWQGEGGRVGASWLFAGAEGQTEPYSYVSNFRLGWRLRRQAIKDFIFWEIEPSYNWRINQPYLGRKGVWRLELRLEFLIFDNQAETVERQMR